MCLPLEHADIEFRSLTASWYRILTHLHTKWDAISAGLIVIAFRSSRRL